MGKIFNALEKYKKEKRATRHTEKLKPGDYQALLQYDSVSGKMDFKHPRVDQNPGTVERLMTYRLIEADGSLTPAGKAKYAELKGSEAKTADSAPVSEPAKKVSRLEPHPPRNGRKLKPAPAKPMCRCH